LTVYVACQPQQTEKSRLLASCKELFREAQASFEQGSMPEYVGKVIRNYCWWTDNGISKRSISLFT
jgi:hypothetical protein